MLVGWMNEISNRRFRFRSGCCSNITTSGRAFLTTPFRIACGCPYPWLIFFAVLITLLHNFIYEFNSQCLSSALKTILHEVKEFLSFVVHCCILSLQNSYWLNKNILRKLMSDNDIRTHSFIKITSDGFLYVFKKRLTSNLGWGSRHQKVFSNS